MKITGTQFNKTQKTFRNHSLSKRKKGEMLTSIYRDSQSIPSHIPVSTPSPYWSLFRHKQLVGLAMMLLLIFGTTTASAYSLPGDTLYVVKVRVLEPIVLALQTSAEARLEYRHTMLDKRIAELEMLDERGTVSEEAQQESYLATQKIVVSLRNVASETVSMSLESDSVDPLQSQIEQYNSLVSSSFHIDASLDTSLGGDIPNGDEPIDGGGSDSNSSGLFDTGTTSTTTEVDIRLEPDGVNPSPSILDVPSINIEPNTGLDI